MQGDMELQADVEEHIVNAKCQTVLELYRSVVAVLLNKKFHTQVPLTNQRHSEILELEVVTKDLHTPVGLVRILVMGTTIIIHFRINGGVLLSWSRDLAKCIRFDVPVSYQSFKNPHLDFANINSALAESSELQRRAHEFDINLPLLDKLPTPVLHKIFSCLPGKDLKEVCFVNKRFLSVAYSDDLWKRICRSHSWYSRIRNPDNLTGQWRKIYGNYQQNRSKRRTQLLSRNPQIMIINRRRGRRGNNANVAVGAADDVRPIMVIDRRRGRRNNQVQVHIGGRPERNRQVNPQQAHPPNPPNRPARPNLANHWHHVEANRAPAPPPRQAPPPAPPPARPPPPRPPAQPEVLYKGTNCVHPRGTVSIQIDANAPAPAGAARDNPAAPVQRNAAAPAAPGRAAPPPPDAVGRAIAQGLGLGASAVRTDLRTHRHSVDELRDILNGFRNTAARNILNDAANNIEAIHAPKTSKPGIPVHSSPQVSSSSAVTGPPTDPQLTELLYWQVLERLKVPSGSNRTVGPSGTRTTTSNSFSVLQNLLVTRIKTALARVLGQVEPKPSQVTYVFPKRDYTNEAENSQIRETNTRLVGFMEQLRALFLSAPIPVNLEMTDYEKTEEDSSLRLLADSPDVIRMTQFLITSLSHKRNMPLELGAIVLNNTQLQNTDQLITSQLPNVRFKLRIFADRDAQVIDINRADTALCDVPDVGKTADVASNSGQATNSSQAQSSADAGDLAEALSTALMSTLANPPSTSTPHNSLETSSSSTSSRSDITITNAGTNNSSATEGSPSPKSGKRRATNSDVELDVIGEKPGKWAKTEP